MSFDEYKRMSIARPRMTASTGMNGQTYRLLKLSGGPDLPNLIHKIIVNDAGNRSLVQKSIVSTRNSYTEVPGDPNLHGVFVLRFVKKPPNFFGFL